MGNVMVSVYCLTYNHETYIADALKGFVNQRTNFDFEVIVHDDASQDKTADIIREYAEKYPNIIKPILQRKNVYSTGRNILTEIIAPKMSGQYVAICEGDDYWLDDTKLQRQVDFLESHLEYSGCVHNTRQVDMKTNKEKVLFSSKERDLELKDVAYEGGQAFHTSSIMYRMRYLRERPEFVDAIRGVGDYPLSIYLTTKGKIKYFPEVMSFYRFNVKGSWTDRIVRTKEATIRQYTQLVEMLEGAKNASPEEFRDILEDAIDFNIYTKNIKIEHYEILEDARYKKFYDSSTFVEKLKIYIKRNVRVIYKVYRLLKRAKK